MPTVNLQDTDVGGDLFITQFVTLATDNPIKSLIGIITLVGVLWLIFQPEIIDLQTCSIVFEINTPRSFPQEMANTTLQNQITSDLLTVLPARITDRRIRLAENLTRGSYDFCAVSHNGTTKNGDRAQYVFVDFDMFIVEPDCRNWDSELACYGVHVTITLDDDVEQQASPESTGRILRLLNDFERDNIFGTINLVSNNSYVTAISEPLTALGLLYQAMLSQDQCGNFPNVIWQLEELLDKSEDLFSPSGDTRNIFKLYARYYLARIMVWQVADEIALDQTQDTSITSCPQPSDTNYTLEYIEQLYFTQNEELETSRLPHWQEPLRDIFRHRSYAGLSNVYYLRYITEIGDSKFVWFDGRYNDSSLRSDVVFYSQLVDDPETDSLCQAKTNLDRIDEFIPPSDSSLADEALRFPYNIGVFNVYSDLLFFTFYTDTICGEQRQQSEQVQIYNAVLGESISDILDFYTPLGTEDCSQADAMTGFCQRALILSDIVMCFYTDQPATEADFVLCYDR